MTSSVISDHGERSRTIQFLKYVLSFLAEKKEAIEVSENPAENGGPLNVSIGVAKEDMGRVIGRQGNIIQALRNLAKVLGVKEGKNVFLVLSEKNSS
ncbi:MAG: KH domain-containing protein [bacterium]|nr:KH domain-containing protein [bacterium]